MKESVFTLKLESELKDAFIAEAEAQHRPASQILRDLMRGYVERQREEREYRAYLHRKVEIARTAMATGNGRTDADVEADFAARRAEILRRNGEAGA